MDRLIAYWRIHPGTPEADTILTNATTDDGQALSPDFLNDHNVGFPVYNTNGTIHAGHLHIDGEPYQQANA